MTEDEKTDLLTNQETFLKAEINNLRYEHSLEVQEAPDGPKAYVLKHQISHLELDLEFIERALSTTS